MATTSKRKPAPARKRSTSAKPARAAGVPKRGADSARNGAPATVASRVRDALASLEALSTRRDRENFARFGIVTADRTFGVSVGNIRKLGKGLGRDHEFAVALWDTGCYEARMLVAFVGEPERTTPAQMDRWCREFDNWAVCDTLCFHLFDRTPHAWSRIAAWGNRREEFVKRAAFALLASLAGHDKHSGDAPFLGSLPLIERAASDDRNFVKKGVSWALRGMGHRSPTLHAAALSLAQRLAESREQAARWVGKDALRDLTRPAVRRKVEERRPTSRK